MCIIQMLRGQQYREKGRLDFVTERYARFSSAISSINQYVQKIESEQMLRYGLKGSHAQYLLAILDSPEGLTAVELAKACRKDKSAVSRALSEMGDRSLVIKEASEHSQYGLRYTLTEKGRSAAQEVSLVAGRAVELASRGLTQEGRVSLYEALDLLSENLKELSEKGIAL